MGYGISNTAGSGFSHAPVGLKIPSTSKLYRGTSTSGPAPVTQPTPNTSGQWQSQSTSRSGPQDFSTLQSIYNQSLGTAPTMVQESEIDRVYNNAVNAAMRLGGEQIRSAAGERGAGPGSGVEAQQARELALRVQQPIAETKVGNLANSVQLQNSRLAQLFGAGALPVSESSSTSSGSSWRDGAGGAVVNQPYGSGSQAGMYGDSGLPAYLQQSAAKVQQPAQNTNPWWQTSYGEMNATGTPYQPTAPYQGSELDRIIALGPGAYDYYASLTGGR